MYHFGSQKSLKSHKFAGMEGLNSPSNRVNSPSNPYDGSPLNSLLEESNLVRFSDEANILMKKYKIENCNNISSLKQNINQRNKLKKLSQIELVNLIFQFGSVLESKFTKLVNRLSAHSYETYFKAESLEERVKELEKLISERELQDKTIISKKRMKKREKAARRRMRFIRRMQEGPSIDVLQDSTIQNLQEQEEIFI